MESFIAGGISKKGVAQPKDNKAVQKGVYCNGCGMCPIVGNRLKSLKMKMFNLCQECDDDDTLNFK